MAPDGSVPGLVPGRRFAASGVSRGPALPRRYSGKKAEHIAFDDTLRLLPVFQPFATDAMVFNRSAAALYRFL